jgi:hypothetical protein
MNATEVLLINLQAGLYETAFLSLPSQGDKLKGGEINGIVTKIWYD